MWVGGLIIADMQGALKVIIGIATELPNSIIYTEEQDTNSYNTPPWISIMPETSSITQAWYKDNYYQQDNTSIIVTKKYDILQPIIIHLEFVDKQELSDIVDKILIALPKRIVLREGVVDIEPQQIEFFLTKGELDPHGAVISINILYAIRENKEIKDKIHQVNFETKI